MKRNCWHPIEGHSDILVGQYVVPNFVSNSVSIELSPNEYLIYSAGASLLDPWPHIEDDKLKVHLLLPNAYHYMGVSAWKARFPNAKLYASEIAIAQFKKKKDFEFSSEVLPVSELSKRLPESFELVEPPGHRAGDVWLVKHASNKTSLWITCDSFLNYDRVSNQPIARMMQKLLGAAPGLKMSQVVKWFILNDRSAFKKWLKDRLDQDKPVTLIPSHGEVRHSDKLADEILNLVEQRL